MRVAGRNVLAAALLVTAAMAAHVGGVTERPKQARPPMVTASPRHATEAGYGQLPLAFEANRGQAGPDVRFLARGPGYGLAVDDHGAVLALRDGAASRGAAVRLSARATNTTPEVVGIDPLVTRVNYFGHSGAHTGVPTYARVSQQGVWPGIDLVWYGRAGELEYDVVVAPGAEPSDVRLGVEGADSLRIDADGTLVVETPTGSLVQHRPVAYQDANGRRRAVTAELVMLGDDEVGLDVGDYDRSLPLVIDPVLTYATYLGGSGDEPRGHVAVDQSGNAYLIGTTLSTDFPVTAGAGEPAAAGGTDAFVAKLNPSGSSLEWATYLGGPGNDAGVDIAVDALGSAYLTGTAAPGFPTTPGAYNTTFNAGSIDVFITKLGASGVLVYSTIVGGSLDETEPAIAVDSAGNAYITGTSAGSGFPVTTLLPEHNRSYVLELNAAGSGLVYSANIGDHQWSPMFADIAVDPSGAAYLTGKLPGPVCTFCTPGAFQTGMQSTVDSFVIKVRPGGTSVAYGTVLGGSGNETGTGIAVDGAGFAYVTGETGAGITGHPDGPGTSQYVAKLNPAGSALVYAGYVGNISAGNTFDNAAIAIDGTGSAWVTGTTSSAAMTVTPDALDATLGGPSDALMAEFNPDGLLAYSTYLGGGGTDRGQGIALDGIGDAYVAGVTGGFPVTAGAFDTTIGGSSDVFVSKLSAGTPTTTTTTVVPSTTTTTTVVPPVGNALDDDTSTLEGSVGQWVPWFSSSIFRSTDQAHGGSASLRVDVTSPYGWGVEQRNWPGFPATPGDKALSFWGRAGSPATGLGATMTVRWRDAGGVVLRSDSASVAGLTTVWQQGSTIVTAPAGTAYVDVTFSHSSGRPGDFVYVGDIVVADSAVGPPPPPSPANLLDADTATIEGSVGQWVPWFSTAVSRTTAQAHGGSAALEVDVTSPWGWGVTLQNWPGFDASPGPHTIEFWGRAGASSGLSATMQVTWRTASGTVLQTDQLALPLFGSWQHASTDVTTPAGTAKVDVDFLNGSGGSGDVILLDDIAVSSAPTPPNLLDADSSTMEGSLGQWAPWFSATASRSTAEAHGGSAALEVDVTAPWGWGVTLSNWPGFDAAPGSHTIGFWAKAGSGTGLSATMQVTWRTASGTVLQTDVIDLSLSGSWQQATADVTAPAGTAKVNVDFLNSSGATGDVIFVDDVAVAGP